MKKVLLGLTGSVASGLLSKIIYGIHHYPSMCNPESSICKVVFTDKARMFLRQQEVWDLGLFKDAGDLFPNDPDNDPHWEVNKKAYGDHDEFRYAKDLYGYADGNPIYHIKLRDMADGLLIAPCSANTMAKMANGICDNLLTSIFRAWDFKKPVYIAPAMNTQMWLHPVTQEHVKKLSAWGVKVIYPTVKKLACGDFGIGGMAHISTIANIIGGHTWQAPIAQQYKLVPPYYPVFPHLGAFGGVRKHDIHMGCDIYCDENSPVYAVEDGEVTFAGQFTGAKVGVPWYNNTQYIAVRGKSGVVVYGEIKRLPNMMRGRPIKKGEQLGNVVKLLKHPPRKDIEHHSSSMLHLELLKQDTKLRYAPGWHHGEKPHADLMDPTPYLQLCSPNLFVNPTKVVKT